MKYLSLCCLILLQISVFANIRLPSILGSDMVLQQNSSVKLWGWGDAGEKVRVTTSWAGKVDSTSVDGNGKWVLSIQTPTAGGPHSVTIKGNNIIELTNVMIGEVWICSGQSNMEMSYSWGMPAMKQDVESAFNSNIRFFQVPKTTALFPQENVGGHWTNCDSNTLKYFSAVAYYFGKKLNADLNVPVGLINASWGGTPAEAWTPSPIVYKDTILVRASRELKTSPWWPVTPGYSFNGMIAPLTNFSIAGAIWYQGESNTGTASTYTRLFTSMIEAWRSSWSKEFPFYFVQLAPFSYGNRNIAALLREAQTKTLVLHKTGMVVTNDLGDDTTDIHPKNKKDVGFRLAKLALVKNYGVSIPGAVSPSFRSMRLNGDQAVVALENIGTGLMHEGKTITGFSVAGEDQQFYPASARISGATIVVSSKDVRVPVAVRYAFSNTAIGNVFSREGMPLSPFRTDNWDVDTSPVR
jgi:sialate O-acetylesterase